MTDSAPTLAQEFESALDWWSAAGVDSDFTDDATAWLLEKLEQEGSSGQSKATAGVAASEGISDSKSAEPARAQPARLNLLGDSPPETLSEFREFWLTAPGLDPIGPRGRVSPRGDANAKLMVLAVEPEEGDRDRLFTGPQGQLLARMLNAMGLTEDEVYFASALPRPTPMADTASIAAAGMDAITAHHIKLAAPKSVLALGGNILPLIGHELPKDPSSLREINLVNPPTPLLVSEGLDSLMTMPRLKARFWRRWIEWSAKR
ncbi:uracil-DNA glycosylase family protein [uncultured Erythrobacter sp.]|uniref:uracil-DNA glycosylase family protein n=1 Tax=uncultured Erythrobacter sp. TaxID=263913 RepID=UPI002613047E|nr:uracil-DNA glycosylase family protein [uncultured Erythrobacter sp.]